MKKLFFGFCLVCTLLVSTYSYVHAYEANYLPGGKNYLAKDNYVYDSGKLDMVDPFVVKPEMDYTLSFPIEVFSPMFELEINFYENIEIVDSITLVDTDFETEEIDVMKGVYSFNTGENVNYLEINFYNVDSETGVIPDLQLEEGLIATTYQDYIEGSMIDTTSPYFQSMGTIISYVDQPISATEILNSLTAYDKVDGDVSDSISIKDDQYTAFVDTLGTYSIIFSVEDSSENVTDIEVVIEVVDVLNPVFSDVSEITVVYPNVYTVEEIKSMLSASDNYDGDISANMTLVEDNYTESNDIVDSYDMQFKVSDSSGNETYHDIVIHVVDQEAPLITGDDVLHIGYNNYYSEDNMLAALTVSDNYDSNLTIVIESNDYKNNASTIGEYQVLFSATDSSGNKTEKTLTVFVVDEIGPMIYLDLAVIQVYSDNVMSLPDFASLLKKTKELDSDKDYLITIKYDSYSSHASIPGTYHMQLMFEDEVGEIIEKDLQIKVIDKLSDGIVFGEENKDISFFQENRNLFIYGGISFVFVGSQCIWFIIVRKHKN